MSFFSAAIYRIDFCFRIIRSVLELVAALIVIQALFLHTTDLAGFNKYEVIMIYALARAVISTVMFIFGSGIEGLYRWIINGHLDRMLLQPMDAQWLASTRIIYVTNSFRLILDWGFWVYSLNKLMIYPTIGQWLGFGVGVISACILYYCLMFAVSIVSFWSMNGELFYLFTSILNVSRYPLDVFSAGLKIVLTIIPVAFLAYIPVLTLIREVSIMTYIAPVFAIVAFVLTRIFWLYGLKAYDSVSV